VWTTTTITSTSAQIGTIQNVKASCDEPTGRATAVATGNNPPYSYLWNTSPPQTTATASNLGSGIYYVVITGNDNCSQILNVKIDTLLDPQLTLVGVQKASCGNADGSIAVDGIFGLPPYSFIWQTNPIQTGSSISGLPLGSYSVVVVDANGCNDTLTTAIQEEPGIADFSWGPSCFGDTTSFKATSNISTATYTWNFGDSSVPANNTGSGAQIDHVFPSIGNYTVSMVASGGCLQDTVIKQVPLNDLPVADFTNSDQGLISGLTVPFHYTGTPGNSFSWDFGQGLSTTGSDPTMVFPDSGYYPVTVVVTDANGCQDTTQTTIYVYKSALIYLANAFSPFTPGPNNYYLVYGYGVKEIDFRIFSRWGNVVYSTQNVNEAMNVGWNGTFHGVQIQQGVYGYKIWVKFVDEREFEKTGTITLVR
jgi:gliding motility-associated-like protein